jgi:ABC-type uncharacterized transport system involved in gliding motility auxiliary subunit
MKGELKRYAPVGLYISLVALFVAIGFYVVQGEVTLAVQISAAFILVGLVVFVILDPDRTRKGLTGRRARFGSNALILILAFGGILIIVNYFAFNNSKRWDLTEDKRNTLALETIEVLENLPEVVTAEAYFTSQMPVGSTSDLLDQFAYASNGKFEYKFIDPDLDIVAAQNAQITRDGTVVVTMNGNQEQVEFVSEQEITSALIRLMNPTDNVIYFLTGHGEYSPEDSGDESYSMLKSKLETRNYQVKTLNLLAVKSIPGDANVIVIGGPLKTVSTEEVDVLSEFVDGGGALIVMEEPLPFTEFGDEPDPLAEYLAQTWGIVLGEDIVVDLTSTEALVAISNQYGNHQITQKMRGLVSIFPTTRSVHPELSLTEGVSQAELVLTADQCCDRRS